jgi:hypothetical protein
MSTPKIKRKIIFLPIKEKGTLAHWKLKQKWKTEFLTRMNLTSLTGDTVIFTRNRTSLREIAHTYPNDSTQVKIVLVEFSATGPYNTKEKDHFTINIRFILYDTEGKILKKKSMKLHFRSGENNQIDPWIEKTVEEIWNFLRK